MISAPAKQPLPRGRPRFLWRGLLIVLPALAMAGFGFVSLRQDRLLARHQATEEAEQLARELVDRHLPAVLRLDLPAVGEASPPGQSGWPTDPVWHAARDGIIAMQVNDAGRLVHPPPLTWPTPEPIELEWLDAAQREAWDTARNIFFRGSDPAEATRQFTTVIEPGWPDRFKALARLHLLNLALREGDLDRGLIHLEALRQQTQTLKTESGLPLRLVAEWRWLQGLVANAADPSQFEESAVTVAALAVLDPGPASTAILPHLGALASELHTLGATRDWLNLWDAHQQARAFDRLLQDTSTERSSASGGSSLNWVEFNNDEFLVLSQPASHGTWWLAWPEATLLDRIQRALQPVSTPAYLDCGVSLDGRPVGAPAPSESVLASSQARLGGATGPVLTATVWLADADRLYAQQRKRTWWFGLLIALSAVSVLGGAMAAWRGFRDQQRLAEMQTNFVSSVSHELRAPIASVRLMAEELVDRGPAETGKAAEYHGYILQECRRLSGLIENVLDFSRHEQGRKEYRFEPTDLVTVVDETIQVMRSYAAERQVALDRQVTGDPFALLADAAALRQVLVNLVDNAVKHSSNGASVEVSIDYPPSGRARRPAEPHLDGQLHPSGGPGRTRPTDAGITVPEQSRMEQAAPQQAHPPQYRSVRLSVRDQGPGIPPEEQALIFQRFYRRGSELRRETPGIGLGLAIVHYIVQAHGGSVRVESEAGHGSRFIVELPVTRTATS